MAESQAEPDAGRNEVAALQTELAATAERANRAEAQLRTANANVMRMADQVESLQLELAETRISLAKCQEEASGTAARARSLSARAGDLDGLVATWRKRVGELELQLATLASEGNRLRLELGLASQSLDEVTSTRTLLTTQLEEASVQQARCASAAAAAEEQHKADTQQLQVRLAACEAECRALLHAKATMHEEVQRMRGDSLSLQGLLQEGARHRDELASENRRRQRELEEALQALSLAQRAQRTTAAGALDLGAELEAARSARASMEAELQASDHRMLRLKEENRQLAERGTELTNQVHALTATVRHLEIENARLADGHAMMRVEVEARAAEVRAARGEAAELAADRARLLAELQATRADGGQSEVERLREALFAARSDVSRLQTEVAANASVMAEAEAALVALVREKETLAQQLEASHAGRQQQQQQRQLQLTGVDVPCGPAPPLHSLLGAGREVPAMSLAAADPSAALQHGHDDRMTTYLQSLVAGGVVAPSSDGGTDVAAATTHAITPEGASDFEPAVPVSVTLVGVTVPALAHAHGVMGRYPVGARTSGSGSAYSAFRQGTALHDAWEATSTSGWDTSAGGSMGGAAVAVPGVRLFSAGAGAGVPELVASELSPRSGTAEPQAPEKLVPPVEGLRAPFGQQERDDQSQVPISPSASCVSAPSEYAGDHPSGGLLLDDGDPAAEVVVTELAPRRPEPITTVNASLSASPEADGLERDEALPASPFAAATATHAFVSDEETRASDATLPPHTGPREDQSSGDQPSPAALPPDEEARSALSAAAERLRSQYIEAAGIAASAVTGPLGPDDIHVGAAAPAVDNASSDGPASGEGIASRSLSAGQLLATSLPSHPAETSSIMQASFTANLSAECHVTPSATSAAQAAITSPTSPAANSATALFGAATGPASAWPSQLAHAVDSSAGWRSDASPQFVTSGIYQAGRETPPAKRAPGDDAGSFHRPGGSTSPMISPRMLLEARMLSRAVRPSADALSGPSRPGFTATMHGAEHAGATSGEQLQQDSGRRDGGLLLSSKTQPILQALSSQQLLRQQQLPHSATVSVGVDGYARSPVRPEAPPHGNVTLVPATPGMGTAAAVPPSTGGPVANLQLLTPTLAPPQSLEAPPIAADLTPVPWSSPGLEATLVGQPPLASHPAGSSVGPGAAAAGEPAGHALLAAAPGLGTGLSSSLGAEDEELAQRLAAMDQALRAIGAA